MKKQLMTLLALSALCVQGFAAEPESTAVSQTLDLNKQGDWCAENNKPYELKDGVFPTSFQVHFFCAHTFMVQPGKKYSFTAEIRSDDSKSYVNIGYVICDKLRKRIPSVHYTGAAESLTKTAAAATEDQNFILIPKNDKWQALFKKGYNFVAFNAKADGSDMPNMSISTKITGITEEGANLKVAFEKPIFAELPAGTGVRLQKNVGFYGHIGGASVNKEWKQIGGKIDMPVSAQYFFPCVIYYGPKDKVIQIRNLKLVIE